MSIDESVGNDLVKSASISGNFIPLPQAKNVPAFLNKLYNMVSDSASDTLIKWSASGESFLVLRPEQVAKHILPRFFKHHNFSSFVRQLNMYGFHKVPHLQHGVLESDSPNEILEFSNPNFLRDQPDLLCLVTRKKGPQPGEDNSPLDYSAIISEIQSIKKHQLTISSDLKRIQMDNQALWQEALNSREKHRHHQETIDKILKFLVSIFSPEKRNIVQKRKRLLLEERSLPEQEQKSQGNYSITNHESFFPSQELPSNEVILPYLIEQGVSQNDENRFTLPYLNTSSLLTHTFHICPKENSTIEHPYSDNMLRIQANDDLAKNIQLDLNSQGENLQSLANLLGMDINQINIGLPVEDNTEIIKNINDENYSLDSKKNSIGYFPNEERNYENVDIDEFLNQYGNDYILDESNSIHSSSSAKDDSTVFQDTTELKEDLNMGKNLLICGSKRKRDY
ncbi:uncharacterized protein T551_01838 [Pneumocystis jirovecii RU7]|uniref:HSF-type DNA-binding domain-containing protein n=2 Tax=Pneumocystis jirovecii TaxID=42068 RepID=A0A0W4ZQ98_PNEJ7|nr:uncharacterized protein T551_01838 [Pneumocystis jirovecii RU7]KTW30555.1 hypothetical protein T551_01838 [Pneumocystis jirovecii RU7]